MTFNYKTKYDENVDYKFFEAMDVEVVQLLPWQFRLKHPDIIGQFVWYPSRGSLIYEKPEWGVSKVGEFLNSEDVYQEMMKKQRGV